MRVEAGELGQDGAEMPLVHHEHVIQALAAKRADQPFGGGLSRAVPGSV